jgi:hypothetical protein
MILVEGDLEFDFSNAVTAVKFDDSHHALSHCMKAVDFVVDLPEVCLFIEVKDPSHPRARAANVAEFMVETTNAELREAIVRKFRDSFLYRWAENKVEKPIHFLSLVTLEQALLTSFQDDLHRHLPFIGPTRWSRPIATNCLVMNIDTWNRNFPKWTVRRLSEVADDHVQVSPAGEA